LLIFLIDTEKLSEHISEYVKVLMVATLTSSFAVCLFPPFYPRLAEEKGCSAAIYGFVIGTNCLASFLVTPVIGKNVSLLQFPESANTFLVLRV
jgi:multisubunit Na+/H+ antiporter MnhG subunit